MNTDTRPGLHVSEHASQHLSLTDNTTEGRLKRMWLAHPLWDWLFALLAIGGTAYAWYYYQGAMDVYEQGILLLVAPSIIALAWRWRPIGYLAIGVAALSILSVVLYQQDIARANQVFLLQYFLSSQTAIFWMSVCFGAATVFYWAGFFADKHAAGLQQTGSALVWGGVVFALVATMVRWHESYLLGADIGHIPVSNLYEVFVLFCWMTALFYLFYESRYQTRQLGAFVLLVVCLAIAFLLWYSISREAYAIQPLVPALKSWWMKLHVPANFVGYGTFALAAMVAIAYLLKAHGPQAVAQRLPNLELLDDLMYKAIAVGFAFFTVATVLGAFWAAEAWGGYWSWDPKETWALIVWLNYAAWLHMRLIKGLRGIMAAWWAIAGLFITAFAFLGVNMFLSGLHSYGEL